MNAAELKAGDWYTFHGFRAQFTGYEHQRYHFTLMTPRGQVDMTIGASQVNREVQ